jgi:hypothetical protein
MWTVPLGILWQNKVQEKLINYAVGCIKPLCRCIKQLNADASLEYKKVGLPVALLSLSSDSPVYSTMTEQPANDKLISEKGIDSPLTVRELLAVLESLFGKGENVTCFICSA